MRKLRTLLVDDSVRQHLGDGNQSQARDWRCGTARPDDLQERVEQIGSRYRLNVLDALQFGAQLRESTHQRIVLHGLALLASQTPS